MRHTGISNSLGSGTHIIAQAFQTIKQIRVARGVQPDFEKLRLYEGEAIGQQEVQREQ